MMQSFQMAESAFDQRRLREVLGRFPTGITIVTSWSAETGRPVGLAVSSFNALSLDPPLVLWSIGLKSSSLHAFRAHDYFAVNVLASDQQHLCDRFGRSGPDKFGGLDYDAGIGGVPLLRGAAAQFQCRTVGRHLQGDHELYIGEVLALDSSSSDPLVFHGGLFRQLQ